MSLDLKNLADELDELRDLRDTCDMCGQSVNDHDDEADPEAHSFKRSEFYDEDRLKALEALEHELGDLHVVYRNKGPFLEDGREWETYAEETAYDIGMCQRGSTLANYVDWKRWADDLQSDYTAVEFDGVTYYYQD